MVRAEEFATGMYAAKRKAYADDDTKLIKLFSDVEGLYQRCAEAIFNLQIYELGKPGEVDIPGWLASRDRHALYEGLANQSKALGKRCFELNSCYFSKYNEYIFGRIDGDEFEVVRLMRWYFDYCSVRA